jgi:hypothetical protein
MILCFSGAGGDARDARVHEAAAPGEKRIEILALLLLLYLFVV